MYNTLFIRKSTPNVHAHHILYTHALIIYPNDGHHTVESVVVALPGAGRPFDAVLRIGIT